MIDDNKSKENEKENIDKSSDTISGRLSTDTLKYFQRVETVLDDNVFDDEDHKAAFMNNVFNEMQGDGTHLARHSQKTSRIIEKIIPCLNGDLFGQFTQLLQEEVDMLSCDRFASHVIETLCKNSTLHVENDTVTEIFVSFCKRLRKQCSVLIRDTYGCHVLSTVLQVLSGVRVPEVVTKSKASRKAKKKIKPKGVQDITEPVVTEVPRIFKKCFKKYVQVIQDDINFGELLCHRNASPVLQVLLLATSKVSEPNYQTLYSAIVSRGKLYELPESGCGIEDDDEFVYRLPVVFTDDVGSHLFEAVIRSASDAHLYELGERCFKRCILSLCIHPLANYLAQTYLRCVKSMEHVEFFICRLLKYVEDILAAGSMSCVVKIAELINKYEKVEYQKKYITTLAEALHIPENAKEKPLCKLLLCMRTYDLLYKTAEPTIIYETKSPDEESKPDVDKPDAESKETSNEVKTQKLTDGDINYHGSCILKNLFSFKKCKMVVQSFLELPVEELKLFACNPNGSFCIETFFQSQWIPMKSKTTLGEMYLSCVQEMTCDKWGSRVIDAVYKGVDDAMQERLKFILRKHKSKLESDLYGRIVLYNCGVKQHVDKMRKIEEQQEKKRKLFEGIISETSEKEVPVAVPKKKKIDDRAAKYRRQLESLGISYNEKEESSRTESENVTEADVSENVPSDDLSDVLQAIEASVTHQGKKKKVS